MKLNAEPYGPTMAMFLPFTTKRLLAATAIAVVVIVAAIWFYKQQPVPPATVEPKEQEAEQKTTIKLSPEKLKNAQLHFALSQMRELEDVRVVPGKIMYNERRRIEMKSPVDGMVKQALVTQSQSVRTGDRLAVISSPEVGTARNEVNQHAAELALDRKEADRAEQIATNLAALLELLKQNPKPADVEKQFEEKVLGSHRQQIVSAYSKLFLANLVATDIQTLETSGGISGRVAQERRSDREVAKATFETACEESKFEASQARDKTQATLKQAERLLAVSRQRLQALGDSDTESDNSQKIALNDLVIRAPFDGDIEERFIVAGAHISSGQTLFVLANTNTLWVSAEIPERDWNTLGHGTQRKLAIRAPSLPDSGTMASVQFIAGQLSPETGTQTIVGELDNHEKKLRPGMFVWVSVPMGRSHRALAVPAAALVTHEQSRFVFRSDGPDTFTRVDVKTGLETPEWIEVTNGLKEGDAVVDQGTFVLKSEMLLEFATK